MATRSIIRNAPTCVLMRVTPAMAQEWLARNVPNNRKLKLHQIEIMAKAMKEGRWLITGETIKFDQNGNLRDGQNRCHSIIKADTAIWTFVAMGLDPAVMDVIDSGTKRTSGDRFKMHGESNANTLAAAVRLVYRYDAGTVIHDHGADFQQLSTILQANPGIRDSVTMASALLREIMPVSTGAGMHYIFSRIDPTQADWFIERLGDGEELSRRNRTAAVLLLREKMIQYRNKQLNIRVQPYHVVALTIKAWNAYRQGQVMKCLKWMNKEGIPEAV